MPLSKNAGLATLALVLAWANPLAAQRGYYREPALAGDVLVFVSEGDLWRVPTRGGIATRLTTHPLQERGPAISPGGKTVAFVGSYEGTPEVYTMPLAGGRPQRRTFGAGRSVRVAGFAPDGRLLFASRHSSTLPNLQLFALDLESGNETRIPLQEASHGAVAADGKTLFFTRFRHRQHVKRYAGGRAEQLWRFDLEARGEAVPLTADWAGTSHAAMPWKDRVYFLSDRDGTRNLWSMDHGGEDLQQHTRHVGLDVLEASLSEGRVAYRLGASLRLLDLATKEDRAIDITLSSDFDQSRERWIERPAERLSSARLSPNGDRVVLVARGQAFVAPAKAKGRPVVQLSRSDKVRYRDAAFLTGERVIVPSDESGEVELWSVDARGGGERTQVTKGSRVLLSSAAPSPDGRRVAWTDRSGAFWLLDTETGAKQRLERDADLVHGLEWSADGRWLAFIRDDAGGLSHIRVHEPATGRTIVATSNRFASRAPAFSSDGRWLWFVSDRHFRTTVRSPWGRYQPEPHFPKTAGLYAVALAKDAVWPFDAVARTEPEKNEKRASEAPAVPLPQARGALYRAPVVPDRFTWVAPVGKAVLYLARGDSGRETTLYRLALEPGAKPVKVASGIRSVDLSADREKLLLRKGSDIFVVGAALKGPLGAKSLADGKVDLSGWRLKYSPREDWEQIFVDSWRLHRDYFYDPGMHGVDWPAMRRRYQPLVARVGDRDELNDLLGQMIGELAALHSRASGGDHRSGPDDISNASLGARIVPDPKNAAWRIEHIYRSDPERPDLRSPLARPDLALKPGDRIRAVDGVPFRPGLHIGSLLREKAGQVVRLECARAAGGELTARVEPISTRADYDLRYHEWELACRDRVEKDGEGKIGYIHLRAMGSRDIGDWVREYAPIYARQGLIIDVRHNGGGNIDSWILSRLSRKAWFYWKSRERRPYWNMQRAFRGHMVVLCNHRTGSDGEAFAEGFRRLGLGKVIGTRTWGGEIWLSRRNRTVDGGVSSAGENGVYGPEGAWLIEGHGVDPDIAVDNPPHAAFRGEDAQLDRAIRHLEALIAKDPRSVPRPPAFPDKSSPDNRRATNGAGVKGK